MLALSPPELLELLKTLLRSNGVRVGPAGKRARARQRRARAVRVALGTQIAPEDLIGVPRIREISPGRFATEFCPPGAILRSTPFLLFVDELNSAVPDVQKAFYSLILDRRLGDYELPPGSRVVAAGNRVEDRALVRPMATALANRCSTSRSNRTRRVARMATVAVQPLVLAFIRARPDRLCETPPSDATPAYPTPRAWHMLSDAIAATSTRLWPALAAGTVGDRAGAEFAAFAVRALDAPTLEAVARGEAPVPRDPELIYFLGASCLARLASHSKEDGELAAKVVIALGSVSKEVAVWAVDAALSQRPASPAVAAFESVLRTSGAQTLAHVLRLSRYARES
jgi:hypothetical protein